ncbi:hypothetical protein MRB53_009449 [Persea americana]|uniref:Uncharacterized protein n=1 Tax=Persea americana TaxID=3435 RepID=A0ACC2LP73_PERAE|nr:hypothetical protein MRB53_009449 [Persea americana]
MEHKPLLQLLVVLLGLSHLLFLASAARPRYLMSGTSLGEMVAQEQMNMNRGMHMVEGFVHGRMEIETNDYSGGANNHHDPKTPERP